MLKTTQVDLVTRLAQLVRDRSTTYLDSLWAIPARHYSDPERARAEREVVLRHTPIVVARSSQLAEPGAYVTADLLGVPLLLVRQDDGSLRALGNACRHRGTQVVESDGCGVAEAFACPYHGWTYARDGALRRIPHHFDSFLSLDKRDFGLTAHPVAERHGFVFAVATAGGEPPDLAGLFGPEADAELEAHGIGDWALAREEVFDEPMNWKVVADGILDPYHPQFVHADTVGPYINNNVYLWDVLSEHAGRLTMSKKGIGDVDPGALRDNPARYVFTNYALMPNTFMVFQSRHFEVWTVQPHPTDPGRSLTHIRVLVSPDFPDAESQQAYVDRNWQLFMKVAHEEDWGVARRAQRGVAGGSLADTVVGRNEAPVHFMHSWLGQRLGDDESTGMRRLEGPAPGGSDPVVRARRDALVAAEAPAVTLEAEQPDQPAAGVDHGEAPQPGPDHAPVGRPQGGCR